MKDEIYQYHDSLNLSLDIFFYRSRLISSNVGTKLQRPIWHQVVVEFGRNVSSLLSNTT